MPQEGGELAQLRQQVVQLDAKLKAEIAKLRSMMTVEEMDPQAAIVQKLRTELQEVHAKVRKLQPLSEQDEKKLGEIRVKMVEKEFEKLGFVKDYHYKASADKNTVEFQQKAIADELASLATKADDARKRAYLFRTEPYCGQCKKPARFAHLQRCMGCVCTAYCSKECQKDHWAKHKPVCLKLQELMTLKCVRCTKPFHTRKNGGGFAPGVQMRRPEDMHYMCATCQKENPLHEDEMFDHHVVACSDDYHTELNGPNGKKACRGCTLNVDMVGQGGDASCPKENCRRGPWCTTECQKTDLHNHEFVCSYPKVVLFVPVVKDDENLL